MLRVPAAALVATLVLSVTSAPARAAPEPVRYTAPVAGVVVDPFRAPDGYGPGNRGLDYRTALGAPVVAAADGEVVFAGPVAGTLHVTVAHADGLRTSYSFLAAVLVVPGQRLRAGEMVGTSTGALHFGVRDPDDIYLDPALLLAGALRATVRLVPGVEEGEPRLRREQQSLLGVVRDRLGAFLAYGIDLGLAEATILTHYAVELLPVTHLARIAAAAERWRRDQEGCTPPDQAPPSPTGRRIVVLVAGLGSTSEGGSSVSDVDTAALGYAPGDVVRFSYTGGIVPGGRPSADLAGLTTTTYTSEDTQADLQAAADRFAALLVDIRRRAPGVPIDVVAHSQGGVVARIGVTDLADAGRLPAEVELFATLGTPHDGADAATLVQAVEASVTGPVALQEIRRRTGLDLDPANPSTGQLAETSALVAQLRRRPVPDQLRAVSVSARADLIVPVPRTIAPGMSSKTVAVGSSSAHGELPGRPEVTRELALARAGLGPTCESLADAVADAFAGEVVATTQDLAGAALLGLVP